MRRAGLFRGKLLGLRSYAVIDGKAVAKRIRTDMKEEISALKAKNPSFRPHLAIVQVGARKDSSSYVGQKLKATKEVGMESTKIALEETVSEEELLKELRALNEDPTVHGIIVQMPLPSHIDSTKVVDEVSFSKDVDG